MTLFLKSPFILIVLQAFAIIYSLFFCSVSRGDENHTIEMPDSWGISEQETESQGDLRPRGRFVLSNATQETFLDRGFTPFQPSSLPFETTLVTLHPLQSGDRPNVDHHLGFQVELETDDLALNTLQQFLSPELSDRNNNEQNNNEQNNNEPDPPRPDILAQAESAGSRPSLRTSPNTPDEPIYQPRSDLILEEGSKYGPGISILTPTAFGKQWRQFSVGFGFQARTRFTNSGDGAYGIGFGLGDADKYVGLDVGTIFTNLSDPFSRGLFTFKLHRRLPQQFAVAVGVNDVLNFGNFGRSDVDGPSPYGVVSKVINLKESTNDLFSRLYLSLGAGTGRYRSEANIFRDDNDLGIFGGVAVRVADPLSVITEWSGQDLSVGLSLRPFKNIPLIITPAATDITGSAGDGVRFIFGVGYSFQF